LGRKLRDAALKNKPGHKTLNIVSINPDTLVLNNRLGHIVGEMNRKLVHIACIQETHLKTNIDKWVENYRFINVAAEPKINTNGSTSYIGGVGILYRVTTSRQCHRGDVYE